MPRVTGEGCIVQLEKDKTKARCRRWQLRVSCGRDKMTGRYVTKTRRVKGTYTDASREMRAFIAEIEGGEGPGHAGVTFERECESFCRRRRTSGLYAESRNRHVECCLRAACRHIGQVDLAEVTPRMLDRMFAAMRAGDTLSGKPSSGTYAKSIGKCVSLVYKQAIKDGRIRTNPCDAAAMPRRDTEPRKAMSAEQLAAFTGQLSPADEHDLAWLLASAMGLRRGEVCGLSWEDFDLPGMCVNVRHSYGRGREMRPTKTKAGRRCLPLTPQLKDALETHKQAQAERLGHLQQPTDPVIATQAGTRVSPDLMEKWWARDRDALGVPGYTIHELRHSYLTALARAGVHPKVMQELAGHASSAITMDIYTHVDMSGKRKAAEALAAALSIGEQESDDSVAALASATRPAA